jgi:aryl-alcohol dehydrogenase-like predicted oxidoreductase
LGGNGPNDIGLSRKHIIEGMRNSIKRLQLDYVDIVFPSRPDTHTPLEEICRAFSWLVDKGLTLYWGTSEWPSNYVVEAIRLCAELKLNPPVMAQVEYNLATRDRFESDYRILFEKYNYATCTWGPLAAGLLSGKYNSGEIPSETRYGADPVAKNLWVPKYFSPAVKENTLKMLNGLADIAKELGCT